MSEQDASLRLPVFNSEFYAEAAAPMLSAPNRLLRRFEGMFISRTMTRSLRTMCHPLARTTWLALYGLDTASAERRAAFLDRVERRIARLA